MTPAFAARSGDFRFADNFRLGEAPTEAVFLELNGGERSGAAPEREDELERFGEFPALPPPGEGERRTGPEDFAAARITGLSGGKLDFSIFRLLGELEFATFGDRGRRGLRELAFAFGALALMNGNSRGDEAPPLAGGEEPASDPAPAPSFELPHPRFKT